jgi:hypothetical protein
MRSIVLTHFIITLYLFGVIWMVQLVHYPLMALVGSANYTEYQRIHMDRMGWVVAAPMCIEALSAFFVLRQDALGPSWERWLGLALVGLIWAVTFFVSVPLHSKLVTGFDAEAHAALVRTNWIRTLAWTARAGLIAMWLSRSVRV